MTKSVLCVENKEGLLQKQVMTLEQADHRELMVKNKHLRTEGGGEEGELQTLSLTAR